MKGNDLLLFDPTFIYVISRPGKTYLKPHGWKGPKPGAELTSDINYKTHSNRNSI
jgi:hypothetical protein